MTSITIPVTTGSDDVIAFAHTGPSPQVGLYVAEPLAEYPTVEEAIAAAVTILQTLVDAGYLPTRNSRMGSND